MGAGCTSTRPPQRILVLGPRFSGKSTIVRQFSLKSGGSRSFSKSERIRFAAFIRRSVINSLRKLCEETEFAGGMIAMSPRRRKFADSGVFTFKEESKVYKDGFIKFCDEVLEERPEITEFSAEIAESMKRLWSDSAVQNCFKVLKEKGKHLDVISNSRFFEKIDEISSKEYIPDDEDIIQGYMEISSASEHALSLGRSKYKIVDPGIAEENKICLPRSSDDIASAVFVFDISEYNKPSLADASITIMEESLRIFEHLCLNEALKDLPILLLLNKKDLFDIKGEVAPGFNDSIVHYLREEFLKKASTRETPIHVLVTEATNSSSLEPVFLFFKEPDRLRRE